MANTNFATGEFEEVYNGIGIIISNNTFDGTTSDRPAYKKEMESITEIFNIFKLEIFPVQNLTLKDYLHFFTTIKNYIIKLIKKRSYKYCKINDFALFIAFLSHGTDKGVMFCDNQILTYQKILKDFDIPELQNDLKWITFSTCRNNPEDNCKIIEEAIISPDNKITVADFDDSILYYRGMGENMLVLFTTRHNRLSIKSDEGSLAIKGLRHLFKSYNGEDLFKFLQTARKTLIPYFYEEILKYRKTIKQVNLPTYPITQCLDIKSTLTRVFEFSNIVEGVYGNPTNISKYNDSCKISNGSLISGCSFTYVNNGANNNTTVEDLNNINYDNTSFEDFRSDDSIQSNRFIIITLEQPWTYPPAPRKFYQSKIDLKNQPKVYSLNTLDNYISL